MAWIQAHIIGRVEEDGRIIVRTEASTLMESPRPTNMTEAGANPAAMERIRTRRPGPINTLAFMGAAAAFIADRSLIGWPGGRLGDRLTQKYGEFGHDVLLIALLRHEGLIPC